MSRSTGTPGSATRHLRRPHLPRFTVRSIAVGLLVLSLAGGASVAENQPADRSDAAALDHRTELEALRSLAETNERTDRGRRSSLSEAAERAAAEAEAATQRASRADEIEPSPAPEPEPEPEPDQPANPPAANDPPPAPGPVPDSCGDYSGNRATGCALLLDAGFELDQMSCLDNLWNKESGWNERAQNPSSGAYGIPQALPGDKMASHGSDWQTNPATQISWGLDYIKGRYSTPCGAWQYFQSNGWY